MIAYADTDVGRSRTMNQDYVFCSMDAVGNLPNLYMVADGMGGHRAGDFASRYAVEVFIETVRTSQSENVISIVNEAITAANHALIQKAEENPDMEGMGTTMVIAVIQGDSLFIANVGDSRLYLIHKEDYEIVQITRDHSLVEEMVKMGELDKNSARTHEKKNIITRAVGADPNMVADFFEIECNVKDRILMCSDGLSNMVEDSQILDIVVNGMQIEDTVHSLIKAANDNGGKDNIAVVLIQPGE